MVEVWLPYESSEIPIMLPDPIDLRIQPRKLFPEKREADALKKLYEILSKIRKIRILKSPLHTDIEFYFISNLLNRLEVNYQIVSEKPNVVIDLPRYDPLIGIKGSVSTYLLTVNEENIFDVLINKSIDNKYINNSMEHLQKNILYIDLMLSGGNNIYEVYYSDDGSHWNDLIQSYVRHWSLKNDFADVVIASIGGGPWDNEVIFIIMSIMKILKHLPDSSIGIVLGDGVISDSDLEKIFIMKKNSPPQDLNDVYLMALQRTLEKYGGKHIYYFGGLPNTFLKYIGVKNLKNIERFIKTLPSKMKRAISVIEDTIHLYPYSGDDA